MSPVAEQASANSRELFGGSIMDPVPDPYAVYARLRAEHPVILMNGWMDTSHLITRYRDVVAGMKDSETFSSIGNARGIGIVIGRTIIEMEGPEHVRHRRIVTPAFSPRALRAGVEESIEEITHELIDHFAPDGHADLVSQFTFTFPLRVLARIMGLPIADFEEFHHWALDLISVGQDPAKGFAASKSIVEYLRPILEERLRDPREDLLTVLVNAEVDGDRLSEEEVLGFLRLLLPAGAETTYRLTGSMMYALLTHPEARARAAESAEGLDLALEETLRWESPVQIVSREATRDVEIDGYVIPKGDLAIFSVGSANRDEARFVNPDRFDLDRENNADHVAFGFGEHFCLGSHLARMETKVAVSALLERFPNLRLDPDRACQVVGVAFRSPDVLPVRFD